MLILCLFLLGLLIFIAYASATFAVIMPISARSTPNQLAKVLLFFDICKCFSIIFKNLLHSICFFLFS